MAERVENQAVGEILCVVGARMTASLRRVKRLSAAPA
jgi:hypothetical protein